MITFNCGAAPVTIAIASTMNLPTGVDTVIDGGNKVTFDGRNAVQIMRFDHGNFMVNNVRVTLQHLTLINGKTTPTERIPTAPAPCSQGWNDGEGGALYMRDGNLTVIDCTFSHNQAAPLGPDTGGGAIYVLGSKNGVIIAGSVFTNNSASNAGAVGGLFAQLAIYNSLFQDNVATGNGANSNDPSRCSFINNDQNEIGSGGNGGAIYQDGGNATNVILCGDYVVNNAAGAGAFGGGVFMTSNDFTRDDDRAGLDHHRQHRRLLDPGQGGQRHEPRHRLRRQRQERHRPELDPAGPLSAVLRAAGRQGIAAGSSPRLRGARCCNHARPRRRHK